MTAETLLPMVTKSLLTYFSEIGREWLLERFEERPGRGDEYFGPIIPYLKQCLQTVVLLFLWNIFKCEGSRPLFVEKTKYKLISRCPPKLVSLPANTRLVSVAGDFFFNSVFHFKN